MTLFGKIELSDINKIYILDTIPLKDHKEKGKIVQISCAEMIAEAIRILCNNDSISRLFTGTIGP